MKVLITGGCGFLGTNIAASYLGAGATVVVIDALFRTGAEENAAWLQQLSAPGQLINHRCDVAAYEELMALIRSSGPFDYVCHLAGQVAMTVSLANPRRDFLTNALGTFNLLEAVRRYSPEALVAFSSTNKVYGDLKHLRYTESATRYEAADFPFGFDELLPLDFASPYGCSKGCADQYVRDWHRNFGLRTVVFRHSSIYGGRQFPTYDQGWIGWFCKEALRQQKDGAVDPLVISGTGKQVRDVLHARDLVTLYHAAYAQRESIAGSIFNIGGGIKNSLSLLELFTILADELGFDLRFRSIERRKSDQDFFVADTRAAQRKLGWSPQVTALDGIREQLDWSRQLR